MHFNKLFLSLFGLLLVACLPVSAPEPTMTPVATEFVTETPTIVWFPASATPTKYVFPTATATPNLKPEVGSLTLTDTFSDAKQWDTAVSDQGSAAISRNRLSLAIDPGVYLTSFRHDLLLGNFYLEITARPSLCRGADNYGIIVRRVGGSYYRFVLSCTSEVWVERVNGGIRLPLTDPLPSGDAPHGAPGEVRIGLWAVGPDLRLFLNDRFQFGIVDKSFPSGGFGVFVRSQGSEPVSVIFSDLTLYNVDYVPATRTPSP